jgi:hypothetical protein
MKIALVLASLIGIGGVGVGAYAAANDTYFVDGNELLRYCRTRDQTQAGLCGGFIIGVSDGTTANAGDAGTSFCEPVKATRGLLRDIVVKWLDAHPDDRARPAAESVTRALKEAFPCPK